MNKTAFGNELCVLLAVLAAGTQCSPTDNGGDGHDTQSCEQIGYSSGVERIGVMQSTDGGTTWTKLGYACFHRPDLLPVDPSPIEDDGKIVLYFLDLNTLAGPPTGSKIIYRADSEDGLDFTEPTIAFSTNQAQITDPCVIRTPEGQYRMYISTGASTISAISDDGRSFTQEQGIRSTDGGVPGALILPDDGVRLFVCGNGIISLTSENGLDFTQDPDTRLSSVDGSILCDPHPIPLSTGSYLMTFKSRPPGAMGPQSDLTYLATSDDAMTWIPGTSPVITGSVPGIVERTDGTLMIYYVDFSAR
ncbi:MAG: hypothetical protein ACUVXJ_13820 [Phycisphaerae bacterium]